VTAELLSHWHPSWASGWREFEAGLARHFPEGPAGD
jgi:hypothetical protein